MRRPRLVCVRRAVHAARWRRDRPHYASGVARVWLSVLFSVTTIVSACSDGDSERGAGTIAATDATVVFNAETTAAPATVSTTTVVATTTTVTSLPAVEGEGTAEATRAAIDGTPLGEWLAVAVTPRPGSPTDPCGVAAIPAMDEALFQDAALVADTVLAELMLNLDASQSELRLACGAGGTGEVTAAMGDIARTVALITERLAEIGAR